MLRTVLALALAAALASTGAAAAQDVMVNVYRMDGGAFTNALLANTLADRTRAAMSLAARDRSPARPVQAPPNALRFAAAPGGSAVPGLAQTYPAERRAEAATTLRFLLSKFGEIERLYGQPSNDLPTALALFVATNYEAATGAELPQDRGAPLIAQMRSALAADASIARASDAQKQALYEQLAIQGMLNAILKQGLKDRRDPALAARLEATGRNNLRALGLDPSTMRFTAQGLRVETAG